MTFFTRSTSAARTFAQDRLAHNSQHVLRNEGGEGRTMVRDVKRKTGRHEDTDTARKHDYQEGTRNLVELGLNLGAPLAMGQPHEQPQLPRTSFSSFSAAMM